MITVQSIDKTTFRVTVEGRTTTTHTVTLSSPYYEKLTSKRVAPEALVERSFEFLLERESNTSTEPCGRETNRGHSRAC